MTQKDKTKNHNSKLQHSFLVEQAKKLNKEWLNNGGVKNRRYFGYLDRKSMSTILIAILFLVIIGDAILVHNYMYK